MNVEPIWPSATFGIRVFGVDLRVPAGLDFAQIAALIHRHKVVAFDNQDLSDEEYLAFARGLGEIVPFKFKNYSTLGRPEIMILNNQGHLTGVGGRKVGNMWHSDSSYQTRPLDLTLLLGKIVPDRKQGGDTLFLDTYHVLSQLDPDLLAKLAVAEARHEVLWTYKVTQEDIGDSLKELVDRLRSKNGYATHPCIVPHPRTGLKNLYINPGYTTGLVGWGSEESKATLEKVFATALKDENIFAYIWKRNDLVIWDNRSTWHMATAVDSSAARIMHRIGIQEPA
jgi:taurine dioxygenase